VKIKVLCSDINTAFTHFFNEETKTQIEGIKSSITLSTSPWRLQDTDPYRKLYPTGCFELNTINFEVLGESPFKVGEWYMLDLSEVEES